MPKWGKHKRTYRKRMSKGPRPKNISFKTCRHSVPPTHSGVFHATVRPTEVSLSVKRKAFARSSDVDGARRVRRR
ncbi:hypothetical protein F2P81_001604 [Scophthalmus maximus]|uniref:Uncharacterized protein n=1 Tax=Scophthalmus maximus TaxID=52904 RepID=A0A6A4TIN1_SCOMX|nr:hypothetical protein F2P81_001604 [Scophthalmus maximus]